ncbi:alginate export family protein [Pseudomonas sp. SG-MS2]|uniref:Alginate export family protein n=1 Tax=Pseudomonas putida TaxID=303 RepID=A0A7Y7Z8H5_PSEPU|nr:MULTISPECIES: alginate export family protein [Pseudomonas]KAF1309362.1 alginate export family protein [Pseudomonas sp. SG-MS2]NWC79763.1 alginate export family protein [Pseudomonas putida]
MTRPLNRWWVPVVLLSIGQCVQAASPLEQSRPGRPGAPRWVEDYRFLDAPAKASDPFDGVRYHRLSESAWLQLGAEARYRADVFNKPFFGLRGLNDDSYLMQRLQAHADLHLFDDAVRTFVQVENTRAFGKDLYSPNDESRNEVRQAFVDFNHDFAQGRYTTRIGRQEMGLGDQAWVTYRDSPNIRLSFDGVRASLNLKDGRKLDAFAFRPLKTGEDSWDDGSNNAVKFYGLYGTFPLTAAWNIDLFAFGLETDDRSLAGEAGDEQRYTFGTRLFGRQQALDWSWNLAGQTGHLGNASIRAWALSSDTGYTFAHAWQPRLGMRIDAASGDRELGDGKVNTFDPLFPRNGVYGEASLTTLSNIIVVGPTFGFSPWRTLRFEPGVFEVWKQRAEDGVYMPGMSLLANTRGTGRHVGTIYRANTRWLATPNLTLDVDLKYYDVSSAIKDAGGEDSSFISLRATFRL